MLQKIQNSDINPKYLILEINIYCFFLICRVSHREIRRMHSFYLACCVKETQDTTTNPGKVNPIVNVLQPPLFSQITHFNPLWSELWCSYCLKDDILNCLTASRKRMRNIPIAKKNEE